MSDQNGRFLHKFMHLYEELLAHKGYGDMAVHVRLVNDNEKEVLLRCGREYRFRIRTGSGRSATRYRLLAAAGRSNGYTGPERRSGMDRRGSGPRRQLHEPRHFRLERRAGGERRNGRGRREKD